MLQRIIHCRAARTLAAALTVTLLWLFGPAQVAHAGTDWLRAELKRREGKAWALSLQEQRALRGRANWPGETRPWQLGQTALGGYGEVNGFSGNLHVAIPIVGWSGKAPISFVLYHNSALTVSGTSAQPPIASGWSHSYQVYLLGAGTS